jgi:hypothetical protein
MSADGQKELFLTDFVGQLSTISTSIERTFIGSREGDPTVDVNEYLRTRDLLLRLFRTYDAEVYRVCFEVRLSNRTLPPR